MSFRPTLVTPQDASWEAARNEERRLCAIVESPDSTEDEKYQALLDLAELTGIFVPQYSNVA